MRRFLAVALLTLAACGGPNIPKPPPSAERVDVAFGSHVVRAEVADTKIRWSYGLMQRKDLARNAGMLFTFPALLSARAGFYMYRTLIPLQIAYMQSLGAGQYSVVAIREMVPCRASDPKKCPFYDPGYPYNAALEVNKGWLTRANVKVGDRVKTSPSGP